MVRFRRIWFILYLLVMIKCNKTMICRSVDIRNSAKELMKLENCTVVEGFVMVVLMERAVESHFNQYSFPQLREITQFLLFFRVNGLQSIGALFPNLEKIGGNQLFDNYYALVVFKMNHLQDLGLQSLREISKGSVIIFKNKSLCYVDTIDWNHLAKNMSVANYITDNRKPKECSECDHCNSGHCWDSSHCQREENVTSNCHPLCIGGCHGPTSRDCFTCRFVRDQNGNCVSQCPLGTYIYAERRCITLEECHSMTLCDDDKIPMCDENMKTKFHVTFNDECVEVCPPGYTNDSKICIPCPGGKCKEECKGGKIISVSDTLFFRGCTVVDGYLEISITTPITSTVRRELEENLGSIKEITGHLRITRSSFTDLTFLRDLTIVHGEVKYALYILENTNLQELWDWGTKTNLTIVRGLVYFHYNPKLCLQHIYKLLEVIRYEHNVSDYEISKASNGDKYPCNASFIDVHVISKTSNSIVFKMPYLQTDYDKSKLYVIYYTKNLNKNVTVFDDLDQCSDYRWMTKDVPVYNNTENSADGFLVNLSELEPNTQYAFYVITYVGNRIRAQSVMLNESTLPTTPSELGQLSAFSKSSSEVALQWQPPNRINGKLEKYVVTWILLDDNRELLLNRDYCKAPMDYSDMRVQNLTTIKPKAIKYNDCCSNSNRYNQDFKEGLEHICFQSSDSARQHYKFLTNCKSYLNEFIYKSPLEKPCTETRSKLHTLNQQNSLNSIDKESEQSVKTKYKKNNIHNKVSYSSEIEHPYPSEIMLSPDSNGTTIKNLQNFKTYIFFIKACRAIHPDEHDVSEDRRCNKAAIKIVRTQPDINADKISDVRFNVEERTLILNWGPPNLVNGFILAFLLEYQQIGCNFAQIKTDCVTYSDFEMGNRKYNINNIAPGEYMFRIRSLSLSGQGLPTKNFYFIIENDNSNLAAMDIAIMILVVLLIFGIIFFASYFVRIQNNNIIIAEVNPYYNHIPDHYEIKREDIEFISEIGVGSFGKVFRGIIKSQNVACAIKVINDDSTKKIRTDFLCEATMMKSLSKAYYIVNLLGVVSVGHPPLVLMELMEQGDLKTYLRSIRGTRPLTTASMIKIATEIADAMSFMESKKFVHRDLAARNCMVRADLTIKVGDFGMARDIYETDYYRKKSKGFLPIRWMAPESLRDGEFTSLSDVWSYGVVLWEVTTMAEQPYQGLSNEQVLHEVVAGRCLQIPMYSPLPLKSIMKSCWKHQSLKRHSFMHIVELLEYYHDEDFKKVAYYYSTEAADQRKKEWEYVDMRSVKEPLLQKQTAGNISLQLSKRPVNSTYAVLSTASEEDIL